jgi:hypothetical protein
MKQRFATAEYDAPNAELTPFIDPSDDVGDRELGLGRVAPDVAHEAAAVAAAVGIEDEDGQLRDRIDPR